MQFVHGTEQSQRSCQHVGQRSPAQTRRSQARAFSVWNDGGVSHQRWGLPPKVGSVSGVSHEKTAANNEQSSALKGSTWAQKAHPRVCQKDLSQQWGRDAGVRRKTDKSCSTVGFDFIVWGRAQARYGVETKQRELATPGYGVATGRLLC